MDADALSTTPAAQAALQALRAAAGAAGPMERHCQRQFAIAGRLAGGRAFDRELLLCACWLHDARLYIPSHDPYVTEGARLADRVLAPFGWPPERLQRCMDACEQHRRSAPSCRAGVGELRCDRADHQRRDDGMAPDRSRYRAHCGAGSADAAGRPTRAGRCRHAAYADNRHQRPCPGPGYRCRSKIERHEGWASLDRNSVGE
jgi:hypothetical protein